MAIKFFSRRVSASVVRFAVIAVAWSATHALCAAESEEFAARKEAWQVELENSDGPEFPAYGSNLFSSLRIDHYDSKDVQLHIAYDPKHPWKLKLTFMRDGKAVFAIDGHFQSSFALRDNKLYFAQYADSAAGCTVLAIDLTTGKEIWKTELHQEQPGGHSGYKNIVALRYSHGGEAIDQPEGSAILIAGSESYCDYVEVLDRQTGEMLAIKNYRVGYYSQQETPAGVTPVADFPKDYKGTPFTDSKYKEGAQRIPGKVVCAYYDLGGEGIAYHDTDAKNSGSGGLNPLDGNYLNEFRAKEGTDTSYTKDFADFWDGQAVEPPLDMLYVGWTEPEEWMNYTVDVAEDGDYTVGILYTSNRGGELSLDVNGKPLGKPIIIASTNDLKDTTAWRQWHHWNLSKDAATVKLSKGRNLLTLHVVEKGNMNFGTLDFKLVK